MNANTNPQGTAKLLITNAPVTNAWADVGEEINAAGMDSIGIFVKLVIGTAGDVNFRIRAVGRLVSAGDEYALPIRTVSSSDVKVEPEYVEFNLDADQNIVLEIPTDQLIPIVQLQCEVGTAGAGVGTHAGVTINRTGRNGRIK